jgi:hypothetical protein
MATTKMRCGQGVAVYVDNAQGRRLMIGREDGGFLRDPIIIGTTKAEARAAIAVLMQLAEELPGDAPAPPIVLGPPAAEP